MADVVVKGFIEFNIFVEGDSEANIFDKCDNYLEFAFDNKNIYDLLFSQSVVEFLQFPNILEVADSSFQTLLESVKEHDRSFYHALLLTLKGFEKNYQQLPIC